MIDLFVFFLVNFRLVPLAGAASSAAVRSCFTLTATRQTRRSGSRRHRAFCGDARQGRAVFAPGAASRRNSAERAQKLWLTDDAGAYAQLTREKIDEYIAGAPSGGNSIPAKIFQKFHRKNETSYDGGDILNNSFKNNKGEIDYRPGQFYKRVVRPGEAHYVPREGVFGAQLEQLEYRDSEMQEDRRVAYKSDKYPYILAAHKYTQPSKQAYRVDMALFEIPQDQPTGDYVVWYAWNSYYGTVLASGRV